MRQASRRSWRIGHTRPVRVVFMVYENTTQAEVLKLIARKTRSSLALEGELPGEGLTALGEDQQDLILTPARQIADETQFEPEDSLENLFRRTRQTGRKNEQYLVDYDCPSPRKTRRTPPPPERRTNRQKPGRPAPSPGESFWQTIPGLPPRAATGNIPREHHPCSTGPWPWRSRGSDPTRRQPEAALPGIRHNHH